MIGPPRPFSQRIDVRYARRRGGGYTLRIFHQGGGGARRIWISSRELPEVASRLVAALPPDEARRLLRATCARLMTDARQS